MSRDVHGPSDESSRVDWTKVAITGKQPHPDRDPEDDE